MIISTPEELKEIVKTAIQEFEAEKGWIRTEFKEKVDHRYTLPEAAGYCRMPIPTFRAHLAKRNVSGSKPGKTWIFTQQDLDKFLEKFHHKTKDEILESATSVFVSKSKKVI